MQDLWGVRGGRMVRVENEALASAHRLCREHAWQDACAQFSLAAGVIDLAAADLEAWAVASYLTGQLETAGWAWANAHKGWLDRGEPWPAIRCAFWQGLTLVERGEYARGSGWFARAARLVEDRPADAPEHAYLRMPVALQAMEGGDPQAALDTLEGITVVADGAGDRDLATLGRLGQGQCLLRLGDIGRGTAILDEVMLAVTGDEVSPLVAGLAYCAVIIAYRQVFDLIRAQQWTAALGTWCLDQQGIKPYRGQCLVHRSELLQLRGRWSDAMAEIRIACEHLADPPGDPVQGMAFYQLGELLRVRGEFTRAEDAYNKANQWGHPVQPGLALLRLGQGRIVDALAALRRVVKEDNSPGQCVQALTAYIEVALAAGELETAKGALDGLVEVAEQFTSPHLSAICDHARGTVVLAGGDAAAAVGALRSASDGWLRLDAPDEAARSRMYLGAAYRNLGDEDSAQLEWNTARLRFAKIGAARDMTLLDEISGRSARNLAGLTGREVEILTHVATGQTNRQIAQDLGISEHTVRRHLQNIYAKLSLQSRAAATAWAYQHHLLGSGD